MWRLTIAAALMLTTMSCRSAKQDIEDICHAPERSKSAGLPREARAQAIAVWLTERLGAEGRQFFAAFATMSPESKAQALREEAAKHGITDCPIIEELRE